MPYCILALTIGRNYRRRIRAGCRQGDCDEPIKFYTVTNYFFEN